MIMVGIGTAIGVQYLLPTNQIRIYSKSYVFGASLNVLLNIPLILLLGAKGAMIATIFSETFVSMFQLYHVRKQLSLRSLFFENQKYIFAAVIMGIAVNLFVNLNLLGPIVTLILGVLVGALSYTLVLLLLRPNVIIGMTSNFLKAHR